jgi:hypothetical protein
MSEKGQLELGNRCSVQLSYRGKLKLNNRGGLQEGAR